MVGKHRLLCPGAQEKGGMIDEKEHYAPVLEKMGA